MIELLDQDKSEKMRDSIYPALLEAAFDQDVRARIHSAGLLPMLVQRAEAETQQRQVLCAELIRICLRGSHAPTIDDLVQSGAIRLCIVLVNQSVAFTYDHPLEHVLSIQEVAAGIMMPLCVTQRNRVSMMT